MRRAKRARKRAQQRRRQRAAGADVPAQHGLALDLVHVLAARPRAAREREVQLARAAARARAPLRPPLDVARVASSTGSTRSRGAGGQPQHALGHALLAVVGELACVGEHAHRHHLERARVAAARLEGAAQLGQARCGCRRRRSGSSRPRTRRRARTRSARPPRRSARAGAAAARGFGHCQLGSKRTNSPEKLATSFDHSSCIASITSRTRARRRFGSMP